MQIKDRLNDQCPLVLGHRGAPNKEIENTIPSYQKAISDGADGVELDVHITKDGKLAVMHDFNTNRVFGIDVVIEDSTMAELKEISTEIPTLDEVFDAIGPCYYDIEIKANISFDKRLCPMLFESLEKRVSFQDKIMVSSFNPLAMRQFSKISKHRYPQAIIYDGPPTTVPKLLQKGQGRLFFPCDALKPKWDIAEREKLGKPKYPIIPWTVDNKETLKDMLALHAPIVITNDTETIVKALEEAGLR